MPSHVRGGSYFSPVLVGLFVDLGHHYDFCTGCHYLECDYGSATVSFASEAGDYAWTFTRRRGCTARGP